MTSEKNSLPLFWTIGVCLLIPIIPFILIGELPGEKWLSNTDENAFLFGLTGAALLAIDVLLPIPSTIVGTMLGARLDFVVGFFWCWCGLIIGNLGGFYMGRLFLKKSSKTIAESPTLLFLAISRPIPILAEAVTFTAGAGQIRLYDFMFISSFANAVFAAALTANGSALVTENPFGIGLLLPTLLPVVGWLVWKIKLKNTQSPLL